MLTAALLGAVLSGDLLTLFIFWEAAAAGAGFLMLYKKNALTLNSTLKYLVMIIIASAFIVFGLSLVYGLTGSLNFWDVRQALVTLADKRLLIIAFIFIAAGYAIETAIVPFHFWLPDAYTAAPAPSAAFLSALVDQGSYYILIRVLVFHLNSTWSVRLDIHVSHHGSINHDSRQPIRINTRQRETFNSKHMRRRRRLQPCGNSKRDTSQLGVVGNLYFFLIGGITTALAFMAVGIINSHGFKTLGRLLRTRQKNAACKLSLGYGWIIICRSSTFRRIHG